MKAMKLRRFVMARRRAVVARPRRYCRATTGGCGEVGTGASAMLAARADDGRYVPFSHPAGDQPGEWRRPHLTKSATRSPGCQRRTVPDRQFVTVPHDWAAPTRRAAPSNRPSPTSTTCMPPSCSTVVCTVAETEGLSVVDEARFFAIVNLVGADTIITAGARKRTGSSGVPSPPSAGATATATMTPW
jgi:hypothetical protein